MNSLPTIAKQGFACGRAFGMPARGRIRWIAAVPVGHVTGEDSVLVTAYPGTPVWRPPSC